SRRGSLVRTLDRPLPLAVDGVYYFSLLVRADKLPTEGQCDLQLALRQRNDPQTQHRLATTVSWSAGSASLCWEGAGNKASFPIEPQRTYLVTGKIVASARQPDQAF